MVDTFPHIEGSVLLLWLRGWAGGQGSGVVHGSRGGLQRAGHLAAAERAGLVDEAQLDVGVAHPPFAPVGLLDADRLADQRLADEDQVAAPFDFAARAHSTHGGVWRIGQLAQGARIGALRDAMEAGRRLKIQRLVRPLVVVDGPERVEPALLLSEGGRRRAGGFRVQRAMHALLRALPPALSPARPPR